MAYNKKATILNFKENMISFEQYTFMRIGSPIRMVRSNVLM